MKPDIVAIVGKSDSGKTTLLEKIIRELTRRGYCLGTVKHTHDGFDMDREGKDSWRHRKAGAAASLVITDTRIALVRADTRSDTEKMRAYLSDRDLILAEGFKNQDLPKIEIFRKDGPHALPLCMADKNLVAFVTDSAYRPRAPVFGLEDIPRLSDFIEQKFLGK